MKGDMTEGKFVPAKSYTRVISQQGRVQTDADFNEQKEILRRYILAHPEAQDTLEGIGRWWLPAGATKPESTQAALDALVADGLIVADDGPRGRVYRRRRPPS